MEYYKIIDSFIQCIIYIYIYLLIKKMDSYIPHNYYDYVIIYFIKKHFFLNPI